jgi:hypothetical protein
MVSWFESVLDDLTSDLQSFQRLTDQINQTMGSAALPQSIFDDCQAIADDLDTLFDTISAFQREARNKGSLDPRLPQLRTRCLNLLTQSEEANGNIYRFDNQIKGAIVEIQHPPQQTTKIDEVRSQLTQLHRSLEDLISSNQLIPQHERLIIELNDSLVESMTEFDQLTVPSTHTTTLPPCIVSIISGRSADNVKGQAPTQIGEDRNLFGDDLSLLVSLLPLSFFDPSSLIDHFSDSVLATLPSRISISPCT